MKKILAIDDNKDNLVLIKYVLQKKMPGYEILLASSGSEGIHLAQQHLPETILLDIFMPDLSGFEVCSLLKSSAQTKSIPIILVSAYGYDPKIRIKGLNEGADAFIIKPYDAAELVALVKVMLRIKNAEDQLREQNIQLEQTIKRQLKEFSNSEERIHQIAGYANEIFWEVDQNGCFRYISPVVEDVLGYAKGDFLGHKYLWDHTSKEHKSQLKKFFLDKLRKKKKFEREKFLFSDFNGNRVWLAISGFPIFNEQNEFTGYRGASQNITERMLHEEKLSTVINTSIDGFCIIDQQGNIQEVNMAIINMTDYTEEELLQMSIFDLEASTSKRIKSRYLSNKKDGHKRFESTHRQKNSNSINVEISINHLGLEKDQRYVFIRDITKEKLAEKARKKDLTRIRNYQKRLKQLNTELVNAEESERKRIAEYIHDGIGQELSIANLKLTSLGKLGLLPKVKKTIGEASNLLNEAIHKTRLLSYDLSPPILFELGLLPAIRWKLDQISDEFNLKCKVISEKEKYTLDNHLRILIYRILCELLANISKHANADKVRVELHEKKDFLYLAVSDNGKGFNYKPTANLSDYGGKGLFSIKERLDSIQGSMQIESRMNKGTSVCIKVPLKQ